MGDQERKWPNRLAYYTVDTLHDRQTIPGLKLKCESPVIAHGECEPWPFIIVTGQANLLEIVISTEVAEPSGLLALRFCTVVLVSHRARSDSFDYRDLHRGGLDLVGKEAAGRLRGVQIMCSITRCLARGSRPEIAYMRSVGGYTSRQETRFLKRLWAVTKGASSRGARHFHFAFGEKNRCPVLLSKNKSSAAAAQFRDRW